MMHLEENYASVCERVAAACGRAGRRTEDVRLVAVSKYVETARMQVLYDLGQRHFGENHAQELREKKTFFEQTDIVVHFIGQLQTNKIKYVCGSAGLIESVDRPVLLDALEKRSAALSLVSDVLVQVNVGGEAQKGGVAPGALDEFLEAVRRAESLRLRGLMCVPPALPPEEARPYFRKMRQIFDSLRQRHPDAALDTLSMGMSHDFEVAIEEGATEVRVGTALFGARDRL